MKKNITQHSVTGYFSLAMHYAQLTVQTASWKDTS